MLYLSRGTIVSKESWVANDPFSGEKMLNFIFTFTFTKENNLLSMKQQKIVGISEYRDNGRLLHVEKRLTNDTILSD